MRVLLVEDDADSGEALRRLLGRAGYHVELAASVAEADRLTSTQAFDVLISDFNLTDGTGPEILAGVARHSPDLIAVALSGSSVEAEVEALREAGFAHYFPKPVDWPTLRTLLAEISRLRSQDRR